LAKFALVTVFEANFARCCPSGLPIIQPIPSYCYDMKTLQKYFIAIVPEGEVQERATELKLQLREQFNLRYALRSPAHITLKMPFLWNEAKEDRLMARLEVFFSQRPAFQLKVRKIGTFGDRVLFVKVEERKELMALQQELVNWCRQELKLVEELSDYAYRPHMTVAFKDVKKNRFSEYLDFVKAQGFSARLEVRQIALLKRKEGKWSVLKLFPLLGPSEVDDDQSPSVD